MSGLHAFFPPSGAAGWVQCPMWATMNQAFPQLDGDPDASAEGQAFHWLCAETLQAHIRTGRFLDIPAGTQAPNGIRVDDEMIQALEVVIDAIGAFIDVPGAKVEETMRNEAVHASLNWGTPDFRAASSWHMHVFDWKYGHAYVDAFENWQLINYVALYLRELNVEPPTDERTLVTLHIVQPRFYGGVEGPHRQWTVKASDLRAHFNILRNAIEKALLPAPVATTGPACLYCPGRFACEANHRSAGIAVDVSYQSPPTELSPEALGNELRILWAAQDRLKARITGLEQHAMSLWREGKQVPHTRIENTMGRLAWTKPISEVIAMGRLMGVELSKPGIITPLQAKQKGFPEDLVAHMADAPSTGAALRFDNGSAARKVFK